MANPTTRVIFATDITTADGKHHKGGAEASIDFHEARDLIHRGLVLPAKTSDLPVTQQPAADAATDTPKGGK